MALRSITLPDLGEGRGYELWLDPGPLPAPSPTPASTKSTGTPPAVPYLMRWLREGCWWEKD